MTGGRRERTTTKAGTTSLALACMVVWVIAAASTGPLGIWLAIGASAVALGVAVPVLDRPAASRLLQPSPRLIFLGEPIEPEHLSRCFARIALRRWNKPLRERPSRQAI